MIADNAMIGNDHVMIPNEESTASSPHDKGELLDSSSHCMPSTSSTSSSSEAGPSTMNSPTESVTRGRRKVKHNNDDWKCSIRKRQRNQGQEYVAKNEMVKRAKILKPGCGQDCRNKCHVKITHEEREMILSNYWKVGCIDRQRDFINSNVRIMETKVSTTKHDSRRQKSWIYFLPLENEQIKVCKQIFLDTLAVSEKSVRTVISKGDECSLTEVDRREKHQNRGNAIDSEKDAIRRHIQSFPKVESHYCWKETGKNYLDASRSIKKMYDLYVESRRETSEGEINKPPCLTTYKNVFYSDFNLAFHQRSKDRCDFCSSYENTAESRSDADYMAHLHLKDACRQYKDSIKRSLEDSTTSAAAVFDLQEVLPTPKSNESSFYYKRQLNTYNFTIYEYGTGQGRNYVWNETIAGRGSNEIGSCLYLYLQECLKQGKKTIHLFSDSCGGQNRNRNILSLLWFCLNKLGFDEIEHVFFVTGHSFNEGDTMHSCIERAARYSSVYNTPQWAQTIRTAKRTAPRFDVNEMDIKDFVSIKSVAEKQKNFELSTDREKISWLKVKKFRLLKDEPNIVRVYYYTENYSILNLQQKIRVVHEVPCVDNIIMQVVNVNPIPISAEKHKDLIDLCEKNIIPLVYHSYYRNLEHE